MITVPLVALVAAFILFVIAAWTRPIGLVPAGLACATFAVLWPMIAI